MRAAIGRRGLLGIACLAIAGLIGLAAIADHRNKNARSDSAELSEWYCQHEGTRCGGPSSERIEAHWNQRQLGYEIAVSVLGATGIALFIAATARAARNKPSG
jgi:hypothetical protein